MDHTPTLYRVAHVSSICQGMYNNSTATSELHDQYRHPMPYNDDAISEFYADQFHHRMRFGFGSLEQLKCWIYDRSIRERLAEAGYVVYEIEPMGEKGVHWEIGDTQAIFSKACEVGIRDLRDI